MCVHDEILFPGLCAQEDIDAAFRRIPIAPEHRWACGVAFVVDGQVRNITYVYKYLYIYIYTYTYILHSSVLC